MAILSTELICFGCASRPTDDTSTTGGAIDTTLRPVFTQFGASAVLALVSDGADTRNVDITGRNAAGELVSETKALNGTTEVLSTNTYERILSVIAQTTSGTRVVTLKQGSGGSTIGTIPLNEKGVYALFINSKTPASSSTIRYEKIFWKNTNGTLTLTSAQVTLTADPSSKIRIGVAASLNDTATVSNRVTSPGVTFVDDSVAQNVPNSQNLTAGAAIGTWIEQTLASADSPVKSTFTTQLSGNSV